MTLTVSIDDRVTSAAAGRVSLYLFPVSMHLFAAIPLALRSNTTRIAYRMGCMLFFTSLLVFWLLAAMFWHAYRRRDKLALNEVERIDTRERIYDDFFMGCFGLLSVAIVHSQFPQFAGLVYFLIAVPKTVIPMTFGAKRAEAEKRMLAGSSPQSPGPRAPEQGPRDR